jgi:hypothetical protein
MNPKPKTSPTTIIILVVLLGLLGFSAFRMIGSMGKPSRKAAASKKSETKATDMPVVPTTSGSKVGKSEAVLSAVEKSNLNPNQFKVFQLNPPKNPFMQEEEWYADELAQIKGYPELKESDYFETNQPILPDLPIIFDEPERWESVTLTRTTTEDPYEIAGRSEDGRVSTSITMTPKPLRDTKVEWRPESDVPLDVLKNPGWEPLYARKLAEAAEAAGKEANIIPGSPEDLFGGVSPDGLDIPVDEVKGEGEGETLVVFGVSRKGKRASALVSYNGSTFIVTEGASLPPRFKVLEVKPDGVVLVEIKDGSSVWVPLQAPPAAATKKAPATT